MNWRGNRGTARVIVPWTQLLADGARKLAEAIERAPETSAVEVEVVEFTAVGTALRARFEIASREPEVRQRVAVAIGATVANYQRGPR